MAADIAAIARNLEAFYSFGAKTVLHVGAGGGQFIGYGRLARRVIAVDPDAEAADLLEAALRDANLEGRFQVVRADLMSVVERADVVFFEFCLHEIADPAAALAHARTLAPETLVADHAPGSRWAWCCGEEAKVDRSWAAADSARPVRAARFLGRQEFPDFAALAAKLGALGEPTASRIAGFRERHDIAIEMPYRFALLR